MAIKGVFFKGLLIALSLALIPVAAVSAQKITPGFRAFNNLIIMIISKS